MNATEIELMVPPDEIGEPKMRHSLKADAHTASPAPRRPADPVDDPHRRNPSPPSYAPPQKEHRPSSPAPPLKK